VVNGTLFFIVAAVVLLYVTPLLPDSARDLILRISKDNLNAVHLTQELSALLVAMGIMAFWAAKNYEQSKTFHIAITTFWGLMVFIHWFDVRGPWHSVAGPIINSIPFVLYLLASWARMK